MKTILMSVQPQFSERIISGEKTLELRKVIPQCGVPFKVVMYESKGREYMFNVKVDTIANDNASRFLDCRRGLPPIRTRKTKNGTEIPYIAYGQQKVVAEFIVDEVTRYDAELFYDDDTFQAINEVGEDADGDEWESTIAIDEEIDTCDLQKQACITKKELIDYLGEGINTVYALHISELKVYDTPKELSEFKKPCPTIYDCCCCKYWQTTSCKINERRLNRPPQNWCYIEEGL